MKRLYYKGIEEGQESFIKIVINKSLVTAKILIRNSDNSWKPKSPPKKFDLNNEVEKREYANFLERYFEINWMEFDAARKQMINQAKTATKSSKADFPISPDDILKKIAKSGKSNPDENKDQ